LDHCHQKLGNPENYTEFIEHVKTKIPINNLTLTKSGYATLNNLEKSNISSSEREMIATITWIDDTILPERIGKVIFNRYKKNYA